MHAIVFILRMEKNMEKIWKTGRRLSEGSCSCYIVVARCLHIKSWQELEQQPMQGKRINKIPNIIHNMPNYKRQRQHVALLATHCANCCCCCTTFVTVSGLVAAFSVAVVVGVAMVFMQICSAPQNPHNVSVLFISLLAGAPNHRFFCVVNFFKKTFLVNWVLLGPHFKPVLYLGQFASEEFLGGIP